MALNGDSPKAGGSYRRGGGAGTVKPERAAINGGNQRVGEAGERDGREEPVAAGTGVSDDRGEPARGRAELPRPASPPPPRGAEEAHEKAVPFGGSLRSD